MRSMYRETRTITLDEDGTQGKPKQAHVELEIDVEGLFRVLGHRAARSKTGKATLGSGLITAWRVKL